MIRLIFAAMLLWIGAADLGAQQSLRGAWATRTYVLSNGTTHQLAGHIFFDRTEWTVLFFVLDDGEPQRGSAEGGTYRLDGQNLVFTHVYNLSAGSGMEGLPETPLRMVARPRGTGPEEPSTIDIDGDVLTIYFPSGNSMIFERLP